MSASPKIADLAALRSLISQRAPGMPAAVSCPLGLPALDAALGGGLPRGCLQEVIPADGGAAAAGFAAGLRGSLDVAVLLYFVACGISRLARFNVTAEALSDESGKVKYFEGTPIPSSVLLVGLIAMLHWQDRLGPALWLGQWEFGGLVLHPLALLFAFSGSAMISTWRVPKL